MSHHLRLAALGALLASAACRTAAPVSTPTPVPAPPATVTPERAPTPAPAPAPAPRADPSAAAVRFMEHMIGHHAQALTMAALARERSERDDLRLLAERIAVSQRDEIAAMQRWLRSKGRAAPDPAHAAHGDHAAMPGMATQIELEGLATSSGRRFDRQFLDLMIRHHEGALVMVREVMAAPGGTQDPMVFTIANDVDADQRAEIARMRALRAKIAG